MLSARLREAAQALLDLPGDDPAAVLGSIDALKVRSSMTLFELVSGAPEFPAVLERYYHGQRDDLTLEIVREFPVHNVLFLDFDGVMQPDYEKSHTLSPEEFTSLRHRVVEQYGDNGYLRLGNGDIAAALYDWTDEAVEGVQRIVGEGNARIVVSSSWRFYDDDDRLQHLLNLRGLGSYFDGALSRDYAVEREDAIKEYVEGHPRSVGQYVAVDDARLQGLDDHFVRIRGGSLKRVHAEKALLILQDEPEAKPIGRP